MKKILCLILTLFFTLLLSTISFADSGEINDPLVPLSPDTTTTLQYDTIEEEIEDEDIAQSAPSTNSKLPQTGGIPAEVFYVLGGTCIVSALVLSLKKSKTSTK